MESVTLNTGATMPALGFGTSPSEVGLSAKSVVAAVKVCLDPYVFLRSERKDRRNQIFKKEEEYFNHIDQINSKVCVQFFCFLFIFLLPFRRDSGTSTALDATGMKRR